jgi:hypothetical protein
MKTIYGELQAHFDNRNNWKQDGWGSWWEPQPEHQGDRPETWDGNAGSSSGGHGAGSPKRTKHFKASTYDPGESST